MNIITVMSKYLIKMLFVTLVDKHVNQAVLKKYPKGIIFVSVYFTYFMLIQIAWAVSFI